MRLKHAQLDEKLKRGQQIDLQAQDLQRQKEYLDKEKALVEAQKMKNTEKEAFLARKEEKIAAQTARLQQTLSE